MKTLENIVFTQSVGKSKFKTIYIMHFALLDKLADKKSDQAMHDQNGKGRRNSNGHDISE